MPLNFSLCVPFHRLYWFVLVSYSNPSFKFDCQMMAFVHYFLCVFLILSLQNCQNNFFLKSPYFLCPLVHAPFPPFVLMLMFCIYAVDCLLYSLTFVNVIHSIIFFCTNVWNKQKKMHFYGLKLNISNFLNVTVQRESVCAYWEGTCRSCTYSHCKSSVH